MTTGRIALARLNASLFALPSCYRGRCQQIRGLNTVNIKWLWPADKETISFDVGHKYGTRMGTFGMAINCAKPLKVRDIKTTLSHLQRKSPEIQVRLRPRGDIMWFCEDDGEIDFKIVDGGLTDVFSSSCENGFSDVKGVPWKVRLIPREMNAPCAMPEVKVSHPHQYDIFLMSHHGLTDGIGISFLAKQMIVLLNDVINGRDIDGSQWTQFIQRDEHWELEADVLQKLNDDPSRLDFVKRSLPDSKKVPLFLQAFPRPPLVTPSTMQLTRALDTNRTSVFRKHCKDHGVSFNGAIAAVVNIAMARIIKDSGISLPFYRIVSGHNVNISRYLKRTAKNVSGGYRMVLSYTSDVDFRSHQNFWDYAEVVNNELKASLNSGLPLEQKVVSEMQHSTTSHEFYESPPPVTHDYCISNIGSFPTPELRLDDPVIVTDAFSYNIVHGFVNMNLIQVLTFRGRCNFTFSYATDYLPDETIQLLADEIVSVFVEVSNKE